MTKTVYKFQYQKNHRHCAVYWDGTRPDGTLMDNHSTSAKNYAHTLSRKYSTGVKVSVVSGGVCAKCLGEGKLRGYGHVFGGVCFTCHGYGYTGKAQDFFAIEKGSA